MRQIANSPTLQDSAPLYGANVRRLMARFNMTLQDVVDATGLDERTVRSILQDVSRPHARTLHKLADGLGVSTDELFRNPRTSQADFDVATNPQVAEAIHNHPALFDNWRDEDFAELYSRFAVGGELTTEGTVATAQAMNARRELLYQASVILESSEGDLLREFIGMLYRRISQDR